MTIHAEMLDILTTLTVDDVSFDSVDKMMHAEDGSYDPAVDALTRELETQLSDVYDTIPRLGAMSATFLLGVIVGSRMAARGVTIE